MNIINCWNPFLRGGPISCAETERCIWRSCCDLMPAAGPVNAISKIINLRMISSMAVLNPQPPSNVTGIVGCLGLH